MIRESSSRPNSQPSQGRRKARPASEDRPQDAYTPSELSSAYATLKSNQYGRYGKLSENDARPYFDAILASLKPGEPVTGPVGVMLGLVNRFNFTQDQVLPTYQLIDQYATSADDRLKLADRFQDVLTHVQRHTASPGMTYDTRPQQAQKQFLQEMEVGHQPAGYSPAELRSAADRLHGNAQGRYGALDDSRRHFKAITDSLKPGEPIDGAVDTMLRIVNGLMFTQDQVIPVYNLIDKYASNAQERLQLTDRFFETLQDVHAHSPQPGMSYDTRPKLAQVQFEKELTTA